MTAKQCLVCHHEGEADIHVAREMMYGNGGRFEYRECPDCGTLQLVDPPADMAPFYTDNYYSYDSSHRSRWPAPERFLKRRRATARLMGGDPLGSLLLRLLGTTPQLDWMRRMKLRQDSAILDVGCGGGELLLELQRDGFIDVTGADPFIDSDLDHGGGLRIHRTDLSGLDRTWDLVMMHHSLEHVPDPATAFTDAARLCRPGGWFLVRIPVADSHAWRTYGVDWIQLDAPRHLFLLTRDAIQRLADAAGFTLQHVEDDATAFQFWGSEQYKLGFPLRDERSHAQAPGELFDEQQISEWRLETKLLNDRGEGDQSIFFLQRK